MPDPHPFSSDGIRWRVTPDFAKRFGPAALANFRSLRESARPLKELRHKRMYECVIRGRPFFLKIYPLGTGLRRLKNALAGSRAQHEWKMSETLRRGKIPAIPISAFGVGPDEGYVLITRYTSVIQLQQMLLDPALPAARRRRLCRDYGRFARAIHDAGIWQYDFNPTNILARWEGTTPRFWLIDFEKMRMKRSLSERSRLDLLCRMNRIPLLTRTDRLRFLLSYLAPGERHRESLRRVIDRLHRMSESQRRRDGAKLAHNCLKENRNYAPFQIGKVRGHYRKHHSDSPVPGISLEWLSNILESDQMDALRTEEVSQPIRAWQEANREGRWPLAVFIRAGQKSGTLLYAPVSSIPTTSR